MTVTVITVDDRWGLRSGTKANLATVNPIPFNREAMLESDTGRIKVGNGVDHWLDLEYINLGIVDFTGLADGYVPVWDAANSRFNMAAPGVASSTAAISITAGVATVDATIDVSTLSLTADATLAISGAPPSGFFFLRVTQTASFALTLPPSVTAIGTYATTATGTEILGFMTLDGGTSFDMVFQQP